MRTIDVSSPDSKHFEDLLLERTKAALANQSGEALIKATAVAAAAAAAAANSTNHSNSHSNNSNSSSLINSSIVDGK